MEFISQEKYAVFEALFKESLMTKLNNAHLARCISTIMSQDVKHWKVIGITEKALSAIINNNYDKPGDKKIQSRPPIKSTT